MFDWTRNARLLCNFFFHFFCQLLWGGRGNIHGVGFWKIPSYVARTQVTITLRGESCRSTTVAKPHCCLLRNFSLSTKFEGKLKFISPCTNFKIIFNFHVHACIHLQVTCIKQTKISFTSNIRNKMYEPKELVSCYK